MKIWWKIDSSFSYRSCCTFSSIIVSVHPIVRLSVCSSVRQTLLQFICLSVCPSVCPSHIKIHGKLLQALNQADVANNVWGRIVSLMVIIHFEKCSDFSKKSTSSPSLDAGPNQVSVIGIGAWIWTTTTTTTTTKMTNKTATTKTTTLDVLTRYSRTDGFRTLQTVSELQTGSRWYRRAHDGTDGLTMVHVGSRWYRRAHDVTDGLTMLHTGSWCCRWAHDVTDELKMLQIGSQWHTRTIQIDSRAYR